MHLGGVVEGYFTSLAVDPQGKGDGDVIGWTRTSPKNNIFTSALEITVYRVGSHKNSLCIFLYDRTEEMKRA